MQNPVQVTLVLLRIRRLISAERPYRLSALDFTQRNPPQVKDKCTGRSSKDRMTPESLFNTSTLLAKSVEETGSGRCAVQDKAVEKGEVQKS